MNPRLSALLGPGEHDAAGTDAANHANLVHQARISLARIGTHRELDGDRLVVGNALTWLAHVAGVE